MFNNEKTAGRIMQKVAKTKSRIFNLNCMWEVEYLYMNRKQAEQAYSRYSMLKWYKIMINLCKDRLSHRQRWF